MTNWAEKIANDLAETILDVPVYSNVDPNREYSGGETIEFNVQSVEAIPTIKSEIYYNFQLVAATRAPSFSEAIELLNELHDPLQNLLDGYVASGDAAAAFISSKEMSADVRGLIEGESFYGILNFSIQEKEEA